MGRTVSSLIVLSIALSISGCKELNIKQFVGMEAKPEIKKKMTQYNISFKQVCNENKSVLGYYDKGQFECNEMSKYRITDEMLEPFIVIEKERRAKLEKEKAEEAEYQKWSTVLNIKERSIVKEWQDSGFTLDEAKKWIDNKFNLSLAKQYRANGVIDPKAFREKLDKEQKEIELKAVEEAKSKEEKRKQELATTDIYAGIQMYSYEYENDFENMLGGMGFSYSNLTGIIETNKENKIIKITLTPALGEIVNKNDINSIEKNLLKKYKLLNTQANKKQLSVEERRRAYSWDLQIWGGQPRWKADYNALQNIKNSSVTKTTTMTFVNKSDKIIFVKVEESVGDKVNYDLKIEYQSKIYLDKIKTAAEQLAEEKAEAKKKTDGAIRGL